MMSRALTFLSFFFASARSLFVSPTYTGHCRSGTADFLCDSIDSSETLDRSPALGMLENLRVGDGSRCAHAATFDPTEASGPHRSLLGVIRRSFRRQLLRCERAWDRAEHRDTVRTKWVSA